MYIFYEVVDPDRALVLGSDRKAELPADVAQEAPRVQRLRFELDRFQLRRHRRPSTQGAVGAGRRAHRLGQDGRRRARRGQRSPRAGKAFYTTPIKALSNQKYGDLVRRHGADRVGLLTGDNAINGDAPSS